MSFLDSMNAESQKASSLKLQKKTQIDFKLPGVWGQQSNVLCTNVTLFVLMDKKQLALC